MHIRIALFTIVLLVQLIAKADMKTCPNGLYPVYADITGRAGTGDASKELFDSDIYDINGDSISMNTKYITLQGECFWYYYDDVVLFNFTGGIDVNRGKLIGCVKTKKDAKPMIFKSCFDQLFKEGEVEKENYE